ncbi:hypothetical protein BU16DRAFT_568442 [Lophium mytilinum]|uniref:Uncharacterized protein n=1 Tax=Lophium mytilinum TaxID=390894 RepID=A0A6A6Q754_9PEZI|nr:hypothetical protein BU16DRAFT_568442 [Lophium mytilinum]
MQQLGEDSADGLESFEVSIDELNRVGAFVSGKTLSLNFNEWVIEMKSEDLANDMAADLKSDPASKDDEIEVNGVPTRVTRHPLPAATSPVTCAAPACNETDLPFSCSSSRLNYYCSKRCRTTHFGKGHEKACRGIKRLLDFDKAYYDFHKRKDRGYYYVRARSE